MGHQTQDYRKILYAFVVVQILIHSVYVSYRYNKHM
jgi:hypothetical protein